ncbi:MAG: small conductance mechanosensitive channel [Paracoccaceae bacterium]|jgi:small conductance mechanosensitive channel
MEHQQEQILSILNQAINSAVSYGLDGVGALAILIVGLIVAGWARRSVLRVLNRAPRVDKTLRPVIASIVRYSILVFVLIAVLAQFGVQTTSIIALLGAAGLALGLALQGTLQNISAGFMLLFLRPFRVGHYIDAEGLSGTVEEIGLFTTHMRTSLGIYLEVPNAKIWNRAILNYSRVTERRLDVVVGISYDDNIDKAQAVLLELMTSDSRVNPAPVPQVLLTELGDSSVILNLRCWAAPDDYARLLYDLNKAVKQRLDTEGITIPFPQRDVHLFEEKALKPIATPR